MRRRNLEMENQIDTDEQDAQLVGQNQNSQPAQILEKPKVNYLLIGLVVLACFVVFGFSGYYIGKQSNFSPSREDKFNTAESTSLSPKETIKPPSNKPITEPSIFPTTKPTTREITYKRMSDWSSYDSDLGFSPQYPSGYSPLKKNPVDPGGGK